MLHWRSVLSVPGHDARKVERAHDFDADHVFFDLEDSVPADRKDEARRLVAEAHRVGDGVRIADEADYELLRELEAPVVWIPKVEFGSDLWAVRTLGCAMVWLIESPSAVVNLDDLLGCGTELVEGLAFGAMDFCAVAGVGYGSSLAMHARCAVALRARACGLQAIDSPCFTLDDEALERAVVRARSCGFTGMGCVTPRQVPLCNLSFDPSAYPSAALIAAAESAAGPCFKFGDELIGPGIVRAARERRL